MFGRALGHIVLAYIGKGDIPGADKPYRRLLAEAPDYTRLPKITFKLADHFNQKARVIDAERMEARAKLNGRVEPPTEGAKTKLWKVTRNEFRAVELLVDLRSRKTKLLELIETYERKAKEGQQQNIPKADYEAAQ